MHNADTIQQVDRRLALYLKGVYTNLEFADWVLHILLADNPKLVIQRLPLSFVEYLRKWLEKVPYSDAEWANAISIRDSQTVCDAAYDPEMQKTVRERERNECRAKCEALRAYFAIQHKPQDY